MTFLKTMKLMTNRSNQRTSFSQLLLLLVFLTLQSQRQMARTQQVLKLAPALYPYPDPYYRSIFAPCDTQPYPPQPYGGPPMVHLQLMGIQQAGVPLPSDAVEEPVFVNAKQYHGILRRRQSRAKAESEHKISKSRKPYLHESRHLHALRRARGCGGRFLNSKKGENQQEDGASGDKSQCNINLNSDKDEVPAEAKS